MWPARMANAWHSVGLADYSAGLMRAFAFFLGYAVGCGGCVAILPAIYRSETRDFFGFGDSVKGNVELSDYFCWCCCPVLSSMQEIRHIGEALEALPPPLPPKPPTPPPERNA